MTDRAFTINAAKTATIDVTNSLSLVGATGAATTGALTKTGVGTLILTGANTYTGATNVNGGTLAITGTLSGTTAVNINSGTLLISANANNVVNTAANVTLNGGTLGLANAVSGKSQGYGSLALSANSVLDFGSGPGNTFSFASVGSHAGGTILALVNWSSTLSGSDPGTGLAGTDDRLIFTTGVTTDFTSVFATNEVSFNGVGGYAAINLTGGGYEIVPVPEPATTALLGSLALCALIGYRERRRFLPCERRSAKA